MKIVKRITLELVEVNWNEHSLLRESFGESIGSGWLVTATDGRYVDSLCWDEMLGQVATLTHSDIKQPRYEMGTLDEHIERARHREEKFRAQRREWHWKEDPR